MVTTGSTTSGNTTTPTPTPQKPKNDAIALLTEDHNKVKKLFKAFEELCEKNDEKGKEELATQICKELTVHTQLEEEIFYPAVRAAINDDDLMNEAMVEHASAKDLISQIQSMAASDPMYDATVTVLSENIDHHVEEEHTEMFPKVQKTNVDLEELGLKMTEHKETLVVD